MVDPTSQNRAMLAKAAASILPGSSPLGQSMQDKVAADEEQLKVDEANNLVMQRDPATLPPEAQAFANPADPANAFKAPEQAQSISTQASAPAAIPAAGMPAQGTDSRAPAGDGFDKLMGEHDKAQSNLQKQAEDDVKKRESALNTVQTKLDEIEKQGPFKFDNRSLWAKSSTGGRVALLVGGFLSSLHESGAKSFQEGVKSAIDRDLALQTKAFEEKKLDKTSLLSQLKDQLGSIDSAKSALQSIMYKGIADKMQFQMQNAQSEQQRKQAERAYTLSKQEADTHAAVAASTIAKNAAASTTGPEKLGSEEKKRYDNAVTALGGIRDMRKALIQSDNTFSMVGDNKFTLAQKKYSEGLGRMQSGGQIGKDEHETFKGFTPGVKDSRDIQLLKLNQAEAEMLRSLKTLGQTDPEGRQVGQRY